MDRRLLLLSLFLSSSLLESGGASVIDNAIEDADMYEGAKQAFATASAFITKSSGKIQKMSMFDKMVMYGTAASYAASAVKQLVDLVLLFQPGTSDTPELAFLKEQFIVVNTKLDALDYEFDEVKNLIDWNTVRVNIWGYESTISSLELMFKLVLNAPSDVRPKFQDMFTANFRREFGDAPEKIFLALVANASASVFQDNVLEVARVYFENDVARVSQVACLMMRTIQRGLLLQAVYLTIKNDTDAQDEAQERWKENFKRIANFAKRMEEKIIAAWPQQYRKDADKFLVKNAASLDNVGLGKELFALLSKKFPFRVWFVVVYTFKSESDTDRFYDNCGEFYKTNVGGKVVIVNSREQGKRFDRRLYDFVFDQVKPEMGNYLPTTKLAKVLFELPDRFNCRRYKFKGIFDTVSMPWVTAPYYSYGWRRTLAYRWFQWAKWYDMIVF